MAYITIRIVTEYYIRKPHIKNSHPFMRRGDEGTCANIVINDTIKDL